MHRQRQSRCALRVLASKPPPSLITGLPRQPVRADAEALPDSPYDGHLPRQVIGDTETLSGCAIERGYVDRG